MTLPLRFYRAQGPDGYLSNLWRCPVFFGGRTFTSSEAAYQYGKPSDLKVAEWLVSAPKPHLVAAAAHALLPFDVRGDWRKVKVARMRAVLRAKFAQHPDLAEKLLATGDAALIEASKTDAFWGEGAKGTGKNMLGKLLMEIRAELRQNPRAWGQDREYHGEDAKASCEAGCGQAVVGGYRGPDGVHRCGSCADLAGLERVHYKVVPGVQP